MIWTNKTWYIYHTVSQTAHTPPQQHAHVGTFTSCKLVHWHLAQVLTGVLAVTWHRRPTSYLPISSTHRELRYLPYSSISAKNSLSSLLTPPPHYHPITWTTYLRRAFVRHDCTWNLTGGHCIIVSRWKKKKKWGVCGGGADGWCPEIPRG